MTDERLQDYNGHFQLFRNWIYYRIENHDMIGSDTIYILKHKSDSIWIKLNGNTDTAIMVKQ